MIERKVINRELRLQLVRELYRLTGARVRLKEASRNMRDVAGKWCGDDEAKKQSYLALSKKTSRLVTEVNKLIPDMEFVTRNLKLLGEDNE